MPFNPTPEQRAAIDHHVRRLNKIFEKLEGKQCTDIQGLLVYYKLAIEQGRGNVALQMMHRVALLPEEQLMGWLQLQQLYEWKPDEKETKPQ